MYNISASSNDVYMGNYFALCWKFWSLVSQNQILTENAYIFLSLYLSMVGGSGKSQM
jgi:hypothetical protein